MTITQAAELRVKWKQRINPIPGLAQQRYAKSHRIASTPDGLNCILARLVDRFQRQMLVDLKALLAFMSRYQLDLGVREAFGCQEGQHLMTEQMWV